MCKLCWDADEKEEKSHDCPETNEPFVVTLTQIKEEVIKKWISTGEKHFRIHKNVVFNAPSSHSYTWDAAEKNDYGQTVSEGTLSIQFV